MQNPGKPNISQICTLLLSPWHQILILYLYINIYMLIYINVCIGMMRSSQENVTDTISPYGRSTGDTQFTPAMPQFSAPKAPTASRSLQNDTEYVIYICIIYVCYTKYVIYIYIYIYIYMLYRVCHICVCYIYVCVMCYIYVCYTEYVIYLCYICVFYICVCYVCDIYVLIYLTFYLWCKCMR